MTADTNKALIARYVDELNARNLSILDTVLADRILVSSRMRTDHPGPPARLSRAQYAANIRARIAALPDYFVTIDDMVAEEDRVVVYWSSRGTHAGELLNVPPTGTVIREHAVTLYVVVEGRITEVHGFWDNADLWQQLGLIPPTEAILNAARP